MRGGAEHLTVWLAQEITEERKGKTMAPQLQQAISDLLAAHAETEEFPFIVSAREDGNLEVTSQDGEDYWIVAVLVTSA